jgi:hypothetical protein
MIDALTDEILTKGFPPFDMAVHSPSGAGRRYATSAAIDFQKRNACARRAFLHLIGEAPVCQPALDAVCESSQGTDPKRV